MATTPFRSRWFPVLVVFTVLEIGLASCGSGGGGGEGGRADEATVDADGCDGPVESPETRFIVDDCGRVVILRGVNVESSSKGDTQAGEHLPESGLDGQSTLHRWGWNSVRFLVFWGALEPEDGRFDDEYLDRVQRWLDWYEDNGIHVVLDMHQDLYAWKVGGNGAPDWAVDTKGKEPAPPVEGQPWFLKGADPAVQNAYQSFWNPTEGQRDLKKDYLEALSHLAERFADHPAVIGIDVMNEPSFANGDLGATLAIQPQAAAGEFVNPNLTTFMQGGIDAVRAHDDDAWVMVEPTSLLNAFPYAGDLDFGALVDPRSGPPRLAYAGHLYQQQVHDGQGYPENDPYLATWESLRAAEADEMHGALWIGEWGGSPDQPRMDAYVDELTDMADRLMAGWAFWSWDPGGWSPVEADGTTPSANGVRLMRVQPRAVAGTPREFSWDGERGVFSMTWAERADAVGDTELAVPAERFPDGISVVLDGAAVPSAAVDEGWDRDRSVLVLDVDRDRSEHTVCVQATGGAACG